MAKKKRKEQKPNAEYVLPAVKFKPTTKRMLAFDPGSRNMGISLVAANEAGHVMVVANSIITSPINDLVNFIEARSLFLSEVALWVDAYQPHGIIAERFQTRGGANMGALSEKVTMMLGLLAGVYTSLPVKWITAATWKNEFQRRFSFQLDDVYPICRTTPHQLDSCYIGCYGLEKGLQRQLIWTPGAIVADAERTSAVKLINRKVRV